MRRCPGLSQDPASTVLASLILLASAILTAGTSSAQDAAPDKSRYTLFDPTPTELLRGFNTDRPTKSNVPFTVDAGRFQYETDLGN